jgi:hypothetical protein
MSINKLSGVTWTGISKVDGVAASGISKVAGVDAPSVSYFLDTYPNPVAAYSLRKLSSTATTAITVENSSGTTADIGFDSNGDLDTAALASHCGSNYGRVSKWWDQSGNANHMEQSTAASRPYIADASGHVITTTTNSIPALDFYFGSTARWLEDTFVTNNGSQFLLTCLLELGTVTATQNFFSQWTASQSTQVMQLQGLNTANWRIIARYDNASANLGRVQTNAALSLGNEYIINSYVSNYAGDVDVNGDTADTDTGFPTTGSINNSSLLTALGRRSDNGNGQYQGLASEVILWSDTTLPDRDNVMADINSYYSIYA